MRHKPPGAAIFVAVPLVTALLLTLFAWPSARLEPRDVPIGVAGPPAAVKTVEQRLGLLLGGSVVAGLTGALVVQSWLEVVGGEWLANVGALGLTVLAIAAAAAGLYALLGERGALLGALTWSSSAIRSPASARPRSCCPSRSAAWAS